MILIIKRRQSYVGRFCLKENQELLLMIPLSIWMFLKKFLSSRTFIYFYNCVLSSFFGHVARRQRRTELRHCELRPHKPKPSKIQVHACIQHFVFAQAITQAQGDYLYDGRSKSWRWVFVCMWCVCVCNDERHTITINSQQIVSTSTSSLTLYTTKKSSTAGLLWSSTSFTSFRCLDRRRLATSPASALMKLGFASLFIWSLVSSWSTVVFVSSFWMAFLHRYKKVTRFTLSLRQAVSFIRLLWLSYLPKSWANAG